MGKHGSTINCKQYKKIPFDKFNLNKWKLRNVLKNGTKVYRCTCLKGIVKVDKDNKFIYPFRGHLPKCHRKYSVYSMDGIEFPKHRKKSNYKQPDEPEKNTDCQEEEEEESTSKVIVKENNKNNQKGSVYKCTKYSLIDDETVIIQRSNKN